MSAKRVVVSKTGIKIPDVAYLETIEQDLLKVEQESRRLRNIAKHSTKSINRDSPLWLFKSGEVLEGRSPSSLPNSPSPY